MLAEPKKKVIYSNPRGTLWANDKEKFGQKMLESMGWKEGQGLGRNQNGITENIKANFKFDNKGLGFKTNAKNWIEDNNVYEQILSDLSKYHKNDQPASNEKTDTVQVKTTNRIRYKKFIKAKNLSIKSKEDIFCVFPTSIKGSGYKPEYESTDKIIDNSNIETDLTNDTEYISKKKKKSNEENKAESFVMINNDLSISDYFQRKMKQKLNQNDPTETDIRLDRNKLRKRKLKMKNKSYD